MKPAAYRRFGAVILIVLVALFGALFALTQPARAASSTVVINEVYGGGGNSGAPYQNDFIELKNLGSSTVDLSSYSVQYQSAGGTTWAATPLTGMIAPGAYYLVKEAAGTGSGPYTPLPTPQATGTINLSATAGKVALVSSTTALTGNGDATAPGVVDYIGFGAVSGAGTNFEGTGAAPAPSNTTSDQRTGADTDQNATDFQAAAPTPGADNSTGGTTPPAGCTTAGSVTIDDITGDNWLSSYDGQSVSCVAGVVTGIRTSGSSKGYWIQQVNNVDSDPNTSEGVFVYTSSAPSNVAVGDSVLVSGSVSNYDPEGNRATTTTSDLDVTEIGSPTTVVLTHSNPLPAPLVVGPTTVPSQYAPDLGGANIEGTSGASGPIVPSRSALDYWRSIEGMRVEVDNARVVGPSAVFGSGSTTDSETYLTDKPTEAETFRGGTELLGENQTPAGLLELIPDDGSNVGASVGDVLTGATIGTVDYSEFGGFVIASTQTGTLDTTNVVKPTIVPPATASQLSVATYNVENLAPSDPDSKFAALGQGLVTNLGTPDIVAVEEVQDNTGATDDGTVAADQTIAKLEAAIKTAGGPSYSAQEIDPVNDMDGGEPGGNIRVVFLYNPAVVSFVPGTQGAGNSTTATAVTTVNGQPGLTLSPGRIDPTNTAWNSSRKPLVGEFSFQGRNVFVIANHFDAKLGDQDQDGRFQFPAQSSATQRAQQATEVHNFTQQILGVNPNSDVVVLGDLNDYQFSPALKTLETGNPDGSGTSILQDLITTLPINQQYTYDYEGVSEVLDHILVSPALQGHTTYQVAHINSEFTNQTSDHDPQVVDLSFPTAGSGPGTGTTTTPVSPTPTATTTPPAATSTVPNLSPPVGTTPQATPDIGVVNAIESKIAAAEKRLDAVTAARAQVLAGDGIAYAGIVNDPAAGGYAINALNYEIYAVKQALASLRAQALALSGVTPHAVGHDANATLAKVALPKPIALTVPAGLGYYGAVLRDEATLREYQQVISTALSRAEQATTGGYTYDAAEQWKALAGYDTKQAAAIRRLASADASLARSLSSALAHHHVSSAAVAAAVKAALHPSRALTIDLKALGGASVLTQSVAQARQLAAKGTPALSLTTLSVREKALAGALKSAATQLSSLAAQAKLAAG